MTTGFSLCTIGARDILSRGDNVLRAFSRCVVRAQVVKPANGIRFLVLWLDDEWAASVARAEKCAQAIFDCLNAGNAGMKLPVVVIYRRGPALEAMK